MADYLEVEAVSAAGEGDSFSGAEDHVMSTVGPLARDAHVAGQDELYLVVHALCQGVRIGAH